MAGELSRTSSVAPESKMPDLPGAEDEPYDRRFAKWMIKNKVGWGSCGAGRCPTFA